jgi:type I restriction enzyme S subunit
MNGWKKTKLGDALDRIIGGGTPSKNNAEYWDGDIFWCSVKDMSDDKFSLSSTEDKISLLGLENSASNLIKKGTVITATRMGLGRAFINKVDMAINQDLKALYPNERIDNNFLLWTIINKRNEIDSLGTGATVKGITLDTLKSIDILLPPISTQLKIASILSAYDDLIENNLKRIKLLEEIAQRTYEEWFVKFRINGEQLPIDEKTGLPVGWEKRKLKEITNIVSGYPFKSTDYVEGGKYKIVTIKNVQDGYFVPSTTDTLVEIPPKVKNEQILHTGDIILSLTGNVGRVCLTYGDDYLLNQRVAKLVPSEKISSGFIYSMMRNEKMINVLENISNGTAQQNLSPINMGNVEIVFPDENTLDNFNKLSDAGVKQICNLYIQNQYLKESRDILLPKLMNGTIKVS